MKKGLIKGMAIGLLLLPKYIIANGACEMNSPIYIQNTTTTIIQNKLTEAQQLPQDPKPAPKPIPVPNPKPFPHPKPHPKPAPLPEPIPQPVPNPVPRTL